MRGPRSTMVVHYLIRFRYTTERTALKYNIPPIIISLLLTAHDIDFERNRIFNTVTCDSLAFHKNHNIVCINSLRAET